MRVTKLAGLLQVVLMVFANHALAQAGWERVFPQWDQYIHKDSISIASKNGTKYVTIWTYYNVSDGRGSISTQYEINCADGVANTKNIFTYNLPSLQGFPIPGREDLLGPSPILPNSFAYDLQKKYCSLLGRFF